ncbi:MAG TPA: hypothetical protein VL688_05635 [Verrucomicrobiae bacterium]|nr:hypothetical protein [Verrucomicrobiae bacterium]
MKTKNSIQPIHEKDNAEETVAYDRNYDPLAEALDLRAAVEHERRLREKSQARMTVKKA